MCPVSLREVLKEFERHRVLIGFEAAGGALGATQVCLPFFGAPFLGTSGPTAGLSHLLKVSLIWLGVAGFPAVRTEPISCADKELF